MKTSTIAIILIAVVVIAVLFGGTTWNFNQGANVGNVFSGRLQANLVTIKRVDSLGYPDTPWAATYCRMVHGSDYSDKVGTIASNAVSGTMKPEDNGIWTLIVDYGTNTTLWLDASETAKQSYVNRIYGQDGDKDGFDEEYVELDFSAVPPTNGFETRNVEVTLVFDPARIATITYTSLTNSSGISTTTYTYQTATGYVSGFTEGDMAKMAKIVLDFSNTGNETYPDLEYWKLTHLKLGPYTLTAAQFGAYDLANKRYELKFGDQINHIGGRDLYYEKNAGTLWCSYELKAYCKYASASKNIVPKITFYYYRPDGTLTAASIEYCKFSS